ncbi:hypothetical protein [Paenibacillus odorifer]|uniref:hypothetical protein n=1 Tax=Paenibacillus odorifer TaxID=189426 RepID=UPI00096F8B49|nr:hypothetical protein [Paenibacillus odorifer]OMD67594.1 hypothetical protein BSK50_29945 [Paenibacillus odorifer]
MFEKLIQTYDRFMYKPASKKDSRLLINKSGEVSVKCLSCNGGKMNFSGIGNTIPTKKIVQFKCDSCDNEESIFIKNTGVSGFMVRVGEEVSYYEVKNEKPSALIGSYRSSRI